MVIKVILKGLNGVSCWHLHVQSQQQKHGVNRV